MHGISINADVDLAVYDQFVACGIADAGVTSLSAETGRHVTVRDAAAAFTPRLAELLRWEPYTPSPDLDAAPGLSVPVGTVSP